MTCLLSSLSSSAFEQRRNWISIHGHQPGHGPGWRRQKRPGSLSNEEPGLRRGQAKPHNRSHAPHARYSALHVSLGSTPPYIKEDDVCKQRNQLFNGLLMTVKSVI